MLKRRVIPTLLWKDFGLVKGTGFDSWRRVGTVLPAIKVYTARAVDELILVDITATAEGREPDYDAIRDVACECFVPLTIGGGVTKVDHVRELLRAGADKVCINSAAYSDPDLIREAARKFGSQCVVASIDVARGPDGVVTCRSHSGARATDRDPAVWAAELERLGAGEILVTSIERDGTMQGYDLDLIASVVAAVSIPVIASGGAAGYEDLHLALARGASAVAAASMFHFTQQTPKEAKDYLAARGIQVRRDHRGSSR